MNKSDTTVVGNVVDSPRLNRTGTGVPVANFRVASTRRRYDQHTQSWVDGNTLWVDVECFGELAGNVARSLVKGDPVIVSGDLYTNEWEGEAGKRSAIRVKADTVGPDLTRGWSEFRRARRAEEPATPPEVTEDVSERSTDYDDDAAMDHAGEPASLHDLAPDEERVPTMA